MGKSQEIVARIEAITADSKTQRELNKEWHQYNKYIRNGGQPQRIDKYCKKNQSTFKSLVIIHRKDFTNPNIMKQLIGWRDMPIKNLDIVQTTNMSISLELFIENYGAYLYPSPNSYTQITTAGAFKLTEKDMAHIISNPSDTVQRGVLVGNIVPYLSIVPKNNKSADEEREILNARRVNSGLYNPNGVLKG